MPPLAAKLPRAVRSALCVLLFALPPRPPLLLSRPPSPRSRVRPLRAPRPSSPRSAGPLPCAPVSGLPHCDSLAASPPSFPSPLTIAPASTPTPSLLRTPRPCDSLSTSLPRLPASILHSLRALRVPCAWYNYGYSALCEKYEKYEKYAGCRGWVQGLGAGSGCRVWVQGLGAGSGCRV